MEAARGDICLDEARAVLAPAVEAASHERRHHELEQVVKPDDECDGDDNLSSHRLST
jgi:hypothetical protein